MTDKQYKRIMRAFFGLLLGMVLLTVVIIYSTHQKTPQVNNYIGTKGPKGDPGKSIIGSQGLQGQPGIGIEGSPGQDSVSNNTVTLQPIYTNVPTPGEKGDMGNAGPAQVLRVNEDCLLQSKYEGDDFWTSLAQLPKPCEVQQ